METKCIALAIVTYVLGLGLGFAANNMFNSNLTGGQGSQLLIGEIEWNFEGDILTMYISIDNIGTTHVAIESISVRKDVVGSTEYADLDPIEINGGSSDIAAGGGETFA